MRCCFVILAVLFVVPPAWANDLAGLRADSCVERLLTLAGEPSAKNLLAARRFYLSLPREVGQQCRVQYAYLLALIHQRSFQEASELASEMAKGQTSDLALWRTSIWLDLTTGKREAALSALERLAQHSPSWRGLSEKELAEFLGAACGFLSGPCSRNIRASDVRTLTNRLRDSLGDDGRILFDRAIKGVLEHHEQLRAQYDRRAQKDLASRSVQLDAAKKSVDRAAQEVNEKRQALHDKHDRRASEAKLIVGDLDKKIKEIEQKRKPLLKQIATLQAEQIALVSQLLPEPAVPSSRSNVAIELAVIQHNRPIRQVLGPVVAKLTTLTVEDAALSQREQELLFSLGATQIKYGGELGKIEEQARSLDKDEKRIEYKSKRIKARSVALGPRLSTEARQLARFSTYMPFPFERERRRLLERQE